MIKILPKSSELVKKEIIEKVQERLDLFGQTRGYDGTVSIGKYITITDDEINTLSEPQKTMVTNFRSECKYYSLISAATWATCYTLLAEVEAGTRIAPTGYSDIESELPELQWPT